jgi:dTMP kinase
VAHGYESIDDLIRIRAGHDLLHVNALEELHGNTLHRGASPLRGVPLGKDDPFALPAKAGRLIVLCGIDGVGKTSQALEAVDWLCSQGFDARYHKALGIRSELDHLASVLGRADHIDLFGSDTARLLGATVRWKSMLGACAELRDPNVWLVMDRYTYCEFAATRQQHAGNEELIRTMYSGLPEPDAAFFLDADPAVAFERIHARGVDGEKKQFLEDFDAAYRSLPELDSLIKLDASRPFADVQAALRAALRARLPELAERGDA